MVQLFRQNKVKPSCSENCFNEADRDRWKTSFLHRYWKQTCGLCWLGFIIYQVAIECDHKFSAKPLCPSSDEIFPARYWYISFIVFGGFVLIMLLLLSKLVQSTAAGEHVSYMIALSITSMATVSTFLTLFFSWGGVCVDTLGVGTSATLWGEWIFNGPFIVFITVAFVEKIVLSRMDMLFIFSFLLCILFGFATVPRQQYELAVFWLILSFIIFLPTLYLPRYVAYDNDLRRFESISIKKADLENQLPQSLEIKLFSAHQSKRYKLSIFLVAAFTMFPVNYLLGLFGAYGVSDTISVYQILTLFIKGYLMYVITEVNTDAHKEYQKLLTEDRRVNESRKVFLKYIFHEVRTPMNSLTIGIDLLSYSENLTDDDREAVSMMHKASAFVNDTLDGVLNMQKIEEGEFELDLSPFIMKDCIMKVLQTFRGAAKAKKICLIKNISSDIPYKLIGDCYRIEHVISNLLSNAIKFSNDNTNVFINVTCDDKFEEASGGLLKKVPVTVSVVDEGPGISESKLKRLFSSFSQTRPTQLQQGQGSGLGLSLCKNLVSLHGGTINVNSVEGQGSTFSVTIPFDVYQSTAPDLLLPRSARDFLLGTGRRHSLASSKSCSKKTTYAGVTAAAVVPHLDTSRVMTSTGSLAGGEKNSPNTVHEPDESIRMVLFPSNQLQLMEAWTARNEDTPRDTRDDPLITLVVDDVMSNRKMLAMLLKKRGMQTLLANDGQETLDMVFGNPDGYKLILMDNLMPVMNGVIAARELRKSGYPYLIIGVTGNVMKDDIAEYIEAGADMVLPKPLNIRMLEKLLAYIDKNGALSQYPHKKLVVDANESLVWA